MNFAKNYQDPWHSLVTPSILGGCQKSIPSKIKVSNASYCWQTTVGMQMQLEEAGVLEMQTLLVDGVTEWWQMVDGARMPLEVEELVPLLMHPHHLSPLFSGLLMWIALLKGEGVMVIPVSVQFLGGLFQYVSCALAYMGFQWYPEDAFTTYNSFTSNSMANIYPYISSYAYPP